MILAIDDSGDPGLKLGKGSSDFFVIAAIFFEDDLDAEETALKIKRLRRVLGWQPKHEFKFRKTSPEIRKKFLAEMKSCNFKVSLAIIDKRLIVDAKRLPGSSSGLYNVTILEATNAFRDKLEMAHIYIDGEGGVDYRRKAKTYFRQNLPKRAIKELTYRDSVEDNLIQLADMVAGAAHRSVERDKDASYLKILKKKIVRTGAEL